VLKKEKGFESEIVEGKDSEKDLIVSKPFSHKIEAKEDKKCELYGNVAIEFFCRGKPSGIDVTESDLWIETVHCPDRTVRVYLLETKNLKNLIKEKKYWKMKPMGDNNVAYGYLFKLKTIQENAELIFEISQSKYYEQLKKISKEE
jgi:hypothetical protein